MVPPQLKFCIRNYRFLLAKNGQGPHVFLTSLSVFDRFVDIGSASS